MMNMTTDDTCLMNQMYPSSYHKEANTQRSMENYTVRLKGTSATTIVALNTASSQEICGKKDDEKGGCLSEIYYYQIGAFIKWHLQLNAAFTNNFV